MNRTKLWLSIFLATGTLLCEVSAQTTKQSTDGLLTDATFEETVTPLLIRRCVECHQGPDPSGGLDLTSLETLLKGGDSGAVIDRDDFSQSYLLERVVQGDMQPAQQGHSQKLSEDEIHVLMQWVGSGAPWPKGRKLDFFEKTSEGRADRDWWSLQPISIPSPPGVTSDPHLANPIDRFVRAKLDQAQV